MSKKLIAFFALTSFLILPTIILGDITIPNAPPQGTLDITTAINNIVNFIWPIFGGVAVIMFIIAGFLYLTARGEPSKIQTANKAILWGVVGVAVAMSSQLFAYAIKSLLLG